MLGSILRTEDRMSMAHSIESRVPFLDYRLVELAASIPATAKVSGDQPKLILKQVAARQVPESIISRRKQGFRRLSTAGSWGRSVPRCVSCCSATVPGRAAILTRVK